MTQDTGEVVMSDVGYKKLMAWRKADDLAVAIYGTTKQFPSEEGSGMTSQIRRAAVSVPTNIAEGSGRQSKKERKRFVSCALGSLAEVEYLLGLSARLGYLTDIAYAEVEAVRKEVGRLLWRLYLSL